MRHVGRVVCAGLRSPRSFARPPVDVGHNPTLLHSLLEQPVLSLCFCRGVEEGKQEGEAPRDVEYAHGLPCQGGEELSPWKRVPCLLRFSKRRFVRTSELCFEARFA